jgi:hypothetical protein
VVAPKARFLKSWTALAVLSSIAIAYPVALLLRQRDATVEELVANLRADPLIYHHDNRGYDISSRTSSDLVERGPAVLPNMRALLNDSSPEMRYAAAFVIANVSSEWSDGSSLPALELALRTEQSPRVLRMCVIAVSYVRDIRAIDLLTTYLCRSDIAGIASTCLARLFREEFDISASTSGTMLPWTESDLLASGRNVEEWWRTLRNRCSWSTIKKKFTVR